MKSLLNDRITAMRKVLTSASASKKLPEVIAERFATTNDVFKPSAKHLDPRTTRSRSRTPSSTAPPTRPLSPQITVTPALPGFSTPASNPSDFSGFAQAAKTSHKEAGDPCSTSVGAKRKNAHSYQYHTKRKKAGNAPSSSSSSSTDTDCEDSDAPSEPIQSDKTSSKRKKTSSRKIQAKKKKAKHAPPSSSSSSSSSSTSSEDDSPASHKTLKDQVDAKFKTLMKASQESVEAKFKALMEASQESFRALAKELYQSIDAKFNQLQDPQEDMIQEDPEVPLDQTEEDNYQEEEAQPQGQGYENGYYEENGEYAVPPLDPTAPPYLLAKRIHPRLLHPQRRRTSTQNTPLWAMMGYILEITSSITLQGKSRPAPIKILRFSGPSSSPKRSAPC